MSLPYQAIQARIAQACADYGRDPQTVNLIAVSKVQPIERVEAVLAAGQRIFGENYVQEAAAKWPELRARFAGVELHMIGPLQSNKARQAVELFDVIHSLDRMSLARKLAGLAQERGSSPALLVQVNTGDEAQKAGVSIAELPKFLAEVRAMDLNPRGLMCIPPEGEDSRPHFATLARLAAEHGLPDLSMGMSADFEAAIAAGARYVRVGSALFGARDYAAKA